MGVQGLWDLASPAGQRVHLSALENRVVAVDASIWLYHFLKAMRDESGNMIEGAHLIGFFRRICKLLYLKIRPVFVFDGPPPRLKLRTLSLRAQQRAAEDRQRRKAVEKLLRNRLQMQLLEAAGAMGEGLGGGAEGEAACPAPPEGQADPAPVPGDVAEDAEAGDESSASSAAEAVAPEEEPPAGSRRWERRRWRRRERLPEEFRGFMSRRRGVSDVRVPELPAEPLRDILQVPDRRKVRGRMREPDEWKGYAVAGGGMVTVPLDGPVRLEEFQQLSPKTKYTLLQRAQEAWYGESRLKAVAAKDDAGAFVNVQLETFLRHIRTNKEIEKVKRAMAAEVLRPAGGGSAEGDKYTPPSWLRSENGDAVAPDASSGSGAGAPEASSRSAVPPEGGDRIGRKGGKGEGRGRRRGPRQLQGAEPSRLQAVHVVSELECLEGATARDEVSPSPGEGDSASGSSQEGEGVAELFGSSFLEDVAAVSTGDCVASLAPTLAGGSAAEVAVVAASPPASQREGAGDASESDGSMAGIDWVDLGTACATTDVLPPSDARRPGSPPRTPPRKRLRVAASPSPRVPRCAGGASEVATAGAGQAGSHVGGVIEGARGLPAHLASPRASAPHAGGSEVSREAPPEARGSSEIGTGTVAIGGIAAHPPSSAAAPVSPRGQEPESPLASEVDGMESPGERPSPVGSDSQLSAAVPSDREAQSSRAAPAAKADPGERPSPVGDSGAAAAPSDREAQSSRAAPQGGDRERPLPAGSGSGAAAAPQARGASSAPAHGGEAWFGSLSLGKVPPLRGSPPGSQTWGSEGPTPSHRSALAPQKNTSV